MDASGHAISSVPASKGFADVKGLPKQTRDLLITTQHVGETLGHIKELRRRNSDFLGADTKSYVDAQVIATEAAVSDIEKLGDQVRKETRIEADSRSSWGGRKGSSNEDTSGKQEKMPSKARLMFSRRDTPKIRHAVNRLNIAYQGLIAAMHCIAAVDGNKAGRCCEGCMDLHHSSNETRRQSEMHDSASSTKVDCDEDENDLCSKRRHQTVSSLSSSSYTLPAIDPDARKTLVIDFDVATQAISEPSTPELKSPESHTSRKNGAADLAEDVTASERIDIAEHSQRESIGRENESTSLADDDTERKSTTSHMHSIRSSDSETAGVIYYTESSPTTPRNRRGAHTHFRDLLLDEDVLHESLPRSTNDSSMETNQFETGLGAAGNSQDQDEAPLSSEQSQQTNVRRAASRHNTGSQTRARCRALATPGSHTDKSDASRKEPRREDSLTPRPSTYGRSTNSQRMKASKIGSNFINLMLDEDEPPVPPPSASKMDSTNAAQPESRSEATVNNHESRSLQSLSTLEDVNPTHRSLPSAPSPDPEAVHEDRDLGSVSRKLSLNADKQRQSSAGTSVDIKTGAKLMEAVPAAIVDPLNPDVVGSSFRSPEKVIPAWVTSSRFVDDKGNTDAKDSSNEWLTPSIPVTCSPALSLSPDDFSSLPIPVRSRTRARAGRVWLEQEAELDGKQSVTMK